MTNDKNIALCQIGSAIDKLNQIQQFIENEEEPPAVPLKDLSELFFELGLIKEYKSIDFDYEEIIRKLANDHNHNADACMRYAFKNIALREEINKISHEVEFTPTVKELIKGLNTDDI